jgi:hypothetical protein
MHAWRVGLLVTTMNKRTFSGSSLLGSLLLGTLGSSYI